MNNASKGLKMVLWGEGLELIGLIAVSVVASLITGSTNLTSNAVVASAIASIAVTILACLLIFFGLVKAGKDERSFSTAWGLLLGYFIGQVAVNIIWIKNPEMTYIKDLIPSFIDIIVTILIFRGMLNLLNKRHLSTAYDKTKTSFIVYIIVSVIGLIIAVVNCFVGIDVERLGQTGQIIALICSIAYIILLIVAYIKYLASLARTSAAIEK